jgi:inhibitor of cysteine peptidase
MKKSGHFFLPFILALIFALSVQGQNFIQIDQNNTGEKVTIAKDEVLEIKLPSTPSTGYGWYLRNANLDILEQVGDWDFISDDLNEPVGSAGTQITRFVGKASGTANLELVYIRPWEQELPLDVYNISVVSEGDYTGNYRAPAPEVVEEYVPSRNSALPAQFSWLAQNKCTPVKNQGSCGSCWAFAAVGSFEAAIKIKDGVTRDIAEQWLVNCTQSGCGGGWCPDKMFQTYGAVYEADVPYKAANGTCKPSYTYHEKITSYKEVATSPTVDQIKQAIYTYGPVWACIAAGSNFSRYKSGVLTASDAGSINHAIVLAGWDDATGSWVLRNSWGTSWGENAGHMRIKYGICKVGYRATYVNYKPSITGIANQDQNNAIQVFPNPSNGEFVINNLEKENTIEIYDMVGKLVYQTVSKNPTCAIDLAGKDKGMYFYKVINANKLVQQGKIIVM